MSWRSCHTVTARCRATFLETTSARTGLKINGRRPSWCRWTQQVTHQSQLVESPSARWSLLSTWEVRLTNREAQTETLQPEQLLSCSKTSGHHLEEAAWEPNSVSSTPMWSQSCCTDVRHGGQHRRCNKRFRHSTTPVWGASPKNPLAGEDPKWRSVGVSGTGTSGQQILQRKWGWIERTLRKPASSITCQALTLNLQGKWTRGWPRNTWRWDTEAELKQKGTNWTGMARAAQNRVRWRGVVDGQCSTWSDGHK